MGATSMTTTIRRLHADESTGLGPLLESLGYPATQEQLRSRVERIIADPAYDIWGAFEGERLVGATAATVRWALETDAPVVQVLAIVTHPEHRRHGVASALLEEVTRWARDHRAGVVAVISGDVREGSSAFYDVHGFVESGRRFERWL